jgi:hypothetical protein
MNSPSSNKTLSRTVLCCCSRIFTMSSGENTKIPKSKLLTDLINESRVNDDKSKIPCVQTVIRASCSRFSCTAYAMSRLSVDDPMNTLGSIFDFLGLEMPEVGKCSDSCGNARWRASKNLRCLSGFAGIDFLIFSKYREAPRLFGRQLIVVLRVSREYDDSQVLMTMMNLL